MRSATDESGDSRFHGESGAAAFTVNVDGASRLGDGATTRRFDDATLTSLVMAEFATPVTPFRLKPEATPSLNCCSSV
jgi:hypothetical protein